MELVVASIIERDGRYLITQRPYNKEYNPGEWEFPGGTVEHGEHPRSALERELKEELGIIVSAGDIFECSSHVSQDGLHVVLIGINCFYISGKIQKKDIIDYFWVFPHEMDDYSISKADLAFVEKLKQISG